MRAGATCGAFEVRAGSKLRCRIGADNCPQAGPPAKIPIFKSSSSAPDLAGPPPLHSYERCTCAWVLLCVGAWTLWSWGGVTLLAGMLGCHNLLGQQTLVLSHAGGGPHRCPTDEPQARQSSLPHHADWWGAPCNSAYSLTSARACHSTHHRLVSGRAAVKASTGVAIEACRHQATGAQQARTQNARPTDV